jgi:isopenicillin-N N-acyltransferase like protein
VTRYFRSIATDPEARGREFGARHAVEVQRTVELYEGVFTRAAGRPVDPRPFGAAALERVAEFSPALHAEMIGLAAGARLSAEQIGAINARTEVLAALNAPARGECSTVVRIDPYSAAPVAVQTWDWYAEFADQWLVWEMPHADGSRVTTVTEFGIVGKAGVTSRGLGLHFNILHHTRDGEGMGVPVHVLARAVLDGSGDINAALQLIHRTAVSASSCLTLVCTDDDASSAVSVEVHPGGPGLVFPAEDGLLVHTNHFLTVPACQHDTEPARFPDTLVRHDLLVRRLRGRTLTSSNVIAAMNSHLGAIGAVCCHPDPSLPATGQYAALATIVLDVAAGTLEARPGGPCRHVA